MPHTRPAAFTLVEMLVVVGMLVLLTGILAPVLSRGRQSAQTARCAAHLRQLGAAWMMYTDGYDEALPAAVSMPDPIDVTPGGPTTILAVLDPHLYGDGAFECPADDRNYFSQRGTSCEYLPGLVIALDPRNAVRLAAAAKLKPHMVPILSDAAEFHTAPAAADPRQAVYYDAHVDWLFESLPTHQEN